MVLSVRRSSLACLRLSLNSLIFRILNFYKYCILHRRRYTVARITIEDCLEKIPSRFQLVHMAAKRVRQIREGSEYLVSSPKNEDIVVALREIAAGKVRIKTAAAD